MNAKSPSFCCIASCKITVSVLLCSEVDYRLFENTCYCPGLIDVGHNGCVRHEVEREVMSMPFELSMEDFTKRALITFKLQDR